MRYLDKAAAAAFAVGCALSALLYWAVGFWSLALPLGVAPAAAPLIGAATPHSHSP